MTELANALREPVMNFVALWSDESEEGRYGGETIITKRDIRRTGYRREVVMGQTRWVAVSKA